MTEAEMQEFLQNHKAEINQRVKEDLIAKIISTHQWDIHTKVAKVCNEFVEKEVLPQIKEHLASQKSVILEAAITAIKGLGPELGKAMLAKAESNMKSYGINRIIESIFK